MQRMKESRSNTEIDDFFCISIFKIVKLSNIKLLYQTIYLFLVDAARRNHVETETKLHQIVWSLKGNRTFFEQIYYLFGRIYTGYLQFSYN